MPSRGKLLVIIDQSWKVCDTTSRSSFEQQLMILGHPSLWLSIQTFIDTRTTRLMKWQERRVKSVGSLQNELSSWTVYLAVFCEMERYGPRMTFNTASITVTSNRLTREEITLDGDIFYNHSSTITFTSVILLTHGFSYTRQKVWNGVGQTIQKFGANNTQKLYKCCRETRNSFQNFGGQKSTINDFSNNDRAFGSNLDILF